MRKRAGPRTSSASWCGCELPRAVDTGPERCDHPFMVALAHGLVGAEDRLLVVRAADATLVAVADGAGGTGSGAEAAEAVLAGLDDASRLDGEPSASALATLDLTQLLATLDARVAATGGETTCVAAVVTDDLVRGASVGDSRAWLIPPDGAPIDLTSAQRRKPLLGSGRAAPVTFGPEALEGTLLLGSDGLFNYLPRDRIAELARAPDLSSIPAALIAAARLPNGDLWDDISIIAVGLAS